METSHEQQEQFLEVPIELSSPEQTQRLVHEVVTDSTKCTHYFIRKSETEAECRNLSCRMGVFINPSDQIIAGQLPEVA